MSSVRFVVVYIVSTRGVVSSCSVVWRSVFRIRFEFKCAGCCTTNGCNKQKSDYHSHLHLRISVLEQYTFRALSLGLCNPSCTYSQFNSVFAPPLMINLIMIKPYSYSALFIFLSFCLVACFLVVVSLSSYSSPNTKPDFLPAPTRKPKLHYMYSTGLEPSYSHPSLV